MTSTTTRPLFHIAQAHGADYSDVLQVADGIKRMLTGTEPREAWFEPALIRVTEPGKYVGGREEDTLYQAIFGHVSDFVALQGSAFRHPPEPMFPIDPGCTDY